MTLPEQIRKLEQMSLPDPSDEREVLNADFYREVAESLTKFHIALSRMERARNILRKDEHSNWGMLDTSDLRPL